MKMENKAIALLKKRKAELDSLREHNDRVRYQLPQKIEEWRTEGIDESVIVGRSIRFYGDLINYDEQELEDINALLKYLMVEGF